MADPIHESSPEQTMLVPADSELLNAPTTETLHVYENGEVLIRTSAVVNESEQTLATTVRSGVCLPDESKRSESTDHPLDGLRNNEIINAYIELIGPVDRTWLETLNKLKIDLLQFRPEHSFLSRATVKAFRQALKQPFVLDVLPIEADIKPQPIAPETGEQEVWIVVQCDRATVPQIIQELSALPEVSIDPDQPLDIVDFYLRLRATVSAQGQAALLHHPKVLAVEPYSPVTPEDEVSGLILAGQYDSSGRPQGSYLRWLEDHGLNGADVTIGIVDAGVEASHPSFAGRIKDLNPDRKSWHGTFVAGHAAGCYLQEKDGNQFIYGLGMAPKADLLIQDNQSTPTALCRETVTETGAAGRSGTVQNNSWGAGTKNPMDYGSQEATYDRLVRNADPEGPVAKPLTICFSAGNSGSNGLTRPKAAKNIIVTGNSENYRPEIGKDQSDNINEIYAGPRGSSHGNCGDGRIVPHLVAPGEWTASANYDSHPGEKEYISSQLTWGSGTSAASPKTAGACALLIQWWRQRNHNQDPSPALLKALLVNGAEPMPLAGFIPNKLQGWGRLNLENVLRPDIQRTYIDQSILLKQRGDRQTWKVRAVNPSLPVKITLCWTDPPAGLGTGTSSTSAIVNKLALRVELNGQVYRGNQFQNGWSYGNGSDDREGWDNLQNVFLPPRTATGTLQVSVTALNITTNCLTGKIDIPQQDFALVITNGVIDSDSSAIFVGIDPNVQVQPVKPTPPQPDPSQPTPPKNPSPKNPSPKSSPTNYWADDHHDGNNLDYAWWQTIGQSSGTPPSSVPKTPKTPNPQQQADAWWLQDDVVWSKPESDRESRLPPAIAQAIQTGINVTTTGQSHQIVMAARNQVETDREGENQGLIVITGDHANKITAETTKDTGHLLQSPIPLSQSLRQLMQNWQQFERGLANNRVAVLLVGRGTRVTPTDIGAMQRLTLLGQLYLVSEDAQLLSFLVQRIHSRSNLMCRLAKDSSGLPTLLRDTLVEASGGQQLAIAQTTQVLESQCIKYCSFDVSSCDRHLTIRIQFPPQQAPKIVLYRPGEPAINLTISSTPELQTVGIQSSISDDFLQFDCSELIAGDWKLLLRQVGSEDVSRVRIWAWNDLQINVTQKILPAASASAQEPNQFEFLMTVGGSDGTTFSRIQGQPRLMYETLNSDTIQAESDRSIEVIAAEPRSSKRQPINEASREIQAPELGTVLLILRPREGAVALDVPLWVEGIDPRGYRFTRLVRHSLIYLEPRSQWRQRLQEQSLQSAIPLFTQAKVIEIIQEGEEIVGLRLQRSDRTQDLQTRSILVASALLKQQLASVLSQPNFAQQEWMVGVVGSELYGLYRNLK